MKKLTFFSFLLLFIAQLSFAQGHRCQEDLFPVKQEENRLYGYKNLFGIWRINPTFTIGYPFRGNVAIVLMGKRYGAVSCEGKMVIQPEYEEIKPFIAGRSWARKGDLWGLISDEGKVIIEPKYSEVNDISRFRTQSWVKEGDKWGLLNRETGELMTDLIYSDYKTLIDSTSLVNVEGRYGILSHNSGKYILDPKMEKVNKIAPYTMSFKQNGKWGMLNDFGKILLDPTYDTLFPKFKFRVQVEKEGKCGLVNLKGQGVTKVVYDEIDDFYENAARVKFDGKYGFISFKGRLVIPLEYTAASRFKNFQVIVEKDGRYGVIGTRNQFIIPNHYKMIQREYSNDYYVAESDTAKHLFSIHGNLVTKETFEDISFTDNENYVRVKNSEGWGYYSIPTKGPSFDGIYSKAEAFLDGFAIVGDGNHIGAIDTLGSLRLDVLYDRIEYKWYGSRLYFQVEKASKYGMINNFGTVVIPVEYDQLIRSDKASIKVQRDDKYGIINASSSKMGEFMVEPKYDYMTNSHSDKNGIDYPAVVQTKGKYGLIDIKSSEVVELVPLKFKNGKYLGGNLFAFKKGKKYALVNYKGHNQTEYDYDELNSYSDKLIGFRIGKLWGYMNVNGKENIPAQFEAIGEFENSIACVKQAGKWGIISRSGKFIMKPQFLDYRVNQQGLQEVKKNDSNWVLLEKVISN